MSTEPRYGKEDVKQFLNPPCRRPLGSFLLLSCPMSISQVTPDSLPGALSLALSLLPNEAKESKWENIRTKESERERDGGGTEDEKLGRKGGRRTLLAGQTDRRVVFSSHLELIQFIYKYC